MFQRIIGVVLASVLTLAGATGGASALTAGPEFRVNTTVSGDQLFPSVAVLTTGGSVVVW